MSRSGPRGVLLLIADDWSPIAACYGNPVIRTPHIDQLAERATVFDHAFCTTPSCAASRASLLTGHHSHTHGQYGHCHPPHGFQTREDFRTVPTVLRDAGVRSALIGKVHVAPDERYPFDFRDTSDTLSPHALAESAQRWLESIGDQPFYLHIATTYPHRGNGPTDYHTAGHRDEFDDVTYDPADVLVPGFLPDVPEVREDLASYYQAVSRFDGFVGRMLAMLDASGRADDTLILLLSDHGMPYPGAKASRFDSGVRCPLLVVDPTRPEASRCDALVNWLDIAPTIYHWLGAADEMPDDLPGRSLLPILHQPHPEGWDETFCSHSFHEVRNYNPYRILRQRRYKYVRNLAAGLPQVLPTDLFRSATWQAVRQRGLSMMGQRPTEAVLQPACEELYDMQNDPWETRNLIDQPELADRVRQMRQRLTEHRRATNDPWLEVDFQEGNPQAPDLGP